MRKHQPVMLREVLHLLAPGMGKCFMDCTFGRGGHTKELLKYGSRVHGLDRDEEAYFAGMSLSSITDHFKMDLGLFSESIIYSEGQYDGVLFDFGLSSTQIHDVEKGMSFGQDAPLLMTMGKNKITAYDVVNSASQEHLEEIIRELGEEPKAQSIAKAIVARRRKIPIKTTHELAKLIQSVVPRRGKDPATQTFQALRMYVNDELNEIVSGLNNALQLCKPGGIIVTISFHSLEDRVVKNFFKPFAFHSKAIHPTRAEILSNRRSRSAKLRWARVV